MTCVHRIVTNALNEGKHALMHVSNYWLILMAAVCRVCMCLCNECARLVDLRGDFRCIDCQRGFDRIVIKINDTMAKAQIALAAVSSL